MHLPSYLSDFFALFFPYHCLMCRRVLVKNEQSLCSFCLYEIPKTDYHKEPDNPVAQKFYGKVPIELAMALYVFRKGGNVQHLLHQLKYQGFTQIGRSLGVMYGKLIRKEGPNIQWDQVVPVPLHKTKLRQRGYNQSDCFAQGLAKGLAIPWNGVGLQRTQKTSTQTEKGKFARWENMRTAFQVVDLKIFMDQHILLVDDVITTGATLEACALALLKGGAKSVSIATIAVAE